MFSAKADYYNFKNKKTIYRNNNNMKTVLIGTSNPSKFNRFTSMLEEYNAHFIGPNEIGITVSPEENGTTPEENARIKASFFGNYHDLVIGNDSGLYFREFSLDDPRQPGLHVRSPYGVRLNDDQMIEYYSALAHSAGGRLTGYYLDACAVWNSGRLTSFMKMGENIECGVFYMVDKPSKLRHEGWPLDSISLDRHSGRYFVDDGNADENTEEEKRIIAEYNNSLLLFLTGSLGLSRK